MLLELQTRLQESTALMTAAEGYSEETRMLVQLSELRTQIKNLGEYEKQLTKDLTAHIKETGEIVQTDTQRASLEPATSVSYDEDALRESLGNRFLSCQELTFSKTKLESLLNLGMVTESEVEKARITKTTDRLMIRQVKK